MTTRRNLRPGESSSSSGGVSRRLPERCRSQPLPMRHTKPTAALNFKSRNISTGRSLSATRSRNDSNKQMVLGNMDKFFDDDDDDDFFSNLDAALGASPYGGKPTKSKFVDNPSTANTPYKTLQQTFDGVIECHALNSDDRKGEKISKAVEEFKKHPDKYLCLYYYAWMRSQPLQDQQCTLVLREGTKKLNVAFDPKGDRTIWIHATGTVGVADHGYQQALEEQEQKQCNYKKNTPTKTPSPPSQPKNFRKPETTKDRQAKQAAAQKKGATARNRRLELDEKRLAQALERAATNHPQSGVGDGGKGARAVQRIPKRSAILAIGGPEADEYNAMIKEEKLAQWQSKAGDNWEILCDHTFDGVATSETTEEETVCFDSVDEAIENFMEDPDKYVAMFFPVHAIKKPNGKKVDVTHILRAGTTNYKPLGVRKGDGGQYALFQHIYHRLDPMEEDLLPKRFRDDFTYDLTFKGKKLHSKKKQKRKPLLPGRGMGLGDSATMTFWGDCAEPNDIFQGTSVGNCWLLSAIACLADFDFAIRRLFRKTPKPKLEDRPQNAPNQYIVTLWDLTTWQEVDVMVDEQLPVRSDNSGFLLGARPSKEGKIWVPYLEKAIAYHCGGYEKLIGGNCTNAWPMLTGSRNQYIMTKNETTKNYKCTARFNTAKQEWAQHANSPRDGDQTTWDVEWPKVGGGGQRGLEMSQDVLFQKIVAWDANNYLIGAATSGTSDRNSTDGLVDNHAYSIIDSRTNICGTGIDLLLIRNPWGEGGELKSAKFARNGPGWKRYPNVQSELSPSTEDNGMCWITKEEFFEHFPTIYLSAFDTARLKEAGYVNDLIDEFPREDPSAPAHIEEEKKVDDDDDDVSHSAAISHVVDEGSTCSAGETKNATKQTSSSESDISEDTNGVSPPTHIDLLQKDEDNNTAGAMKDGTEEKSGAADDHETKPESFRGRANQVKSMTQKFGAEKSGRKKCAAPVKAKSTGGQIELMRKKLEQENVEPKRESISGGRANQVESTKQKIGGEKTSRKKGAAPVKAKSTGGQIELMKKKLEEEKKKPRKETTAEPTKTGKMNQVELMRLKFQGR